MRISLLALLLLSSATNAERLPIFDTHLHYNLGAQDSIDITTVLQKLDDAGIEKVLLSSTDDSGTQMLLQAAPERVLPALRPYRKSGEIKTWMYDQTIIPYLKQQLAEHHYVAFGEFHAFAEHMDLPVVREAVALAKSQELLLHIHGDSGAVTELFRIWPEARVLWAHAGFDDPEAIAPLLAQHSNLWVDLSHRGDISTWAGLAANWRALFEAYPDRFVLGSDTYSIERWNQLGYFALDSRDWLSALPTEIAAQIAYKNAERLFNSR